MIVAASIVLSLLAIAMSIASVVLTLASERRVKANLEAARQISEDDDRDIDDYLFFVADDKTPVRRYTVAG
jgi:hypothetical protein